MTRRWWEEEELELARRQRSSARFTIHNPTFDEISCVDRGDNPGARVVLIKRDEADEDALIEKAIEETRMEGFTKSDAAREMNVLAESIQKQHPEMTPQEAFIAASDSRQGKQLVHLHHRLRRAEPVERRPDGPAPHPAVAAINRRADQVRKDSAAMGEKLTPAEAYAKAMAESPDDVRAYYAS